MKYRYLGFWGMIFASCGGGDEGDLSKVSSSTTLSGFEKYKMAEVSLSETKQTLVDEVLVKISQKTKIPKTKMEFKKYEYSSANSRRLWDSLGSNDVVDLLKFGTEIVFSKLTSEECENLKNNANSYSHAKTKSLYKCGASSTVSLSEVLPLPMQALNHHRLENVFQQYQGENFLTLSNCWSTAYSLLRDIKGGVNGHTLFMASPRQMNDFFNDGASFKEIASFSSGVKSSSMHSSLLEKAQPGDLVVFYTGENIPTHAVMVAFEGIFFEKAGFNVMHAYRTTTFEEVLKLWVDGKMLYKTELIRSQKSSFSSPQELFSTKKVGNTSVFFDQESIAVKNNPFLDLIFEVNSSLSVIPQKYFDEKAYKIN